MVWRLNADPERFDEALEFFRSRVVMTANFARDLDARARTEAFWIGVGLQIHEIEAVRHEIDRAIERGESFQEFRTRVKEQLRSTTHAETVFRNATQRSYNAGRFAQMRDPAVLETRPYWMFDAILDSATTETCREADGTVLPATHPWWDANIPPRHHRCRSSIRNLRPSEAKRRGISFQGPSEAEAGFGAAPGPQDVERLKPNPAKVHPAILTRTEQKRAKPRKPRKPKKKPGAFETPAEHHDPKHWEKHFAAQYGDAAPAVGWGRAMHERALDRPWSEILEEANRLTQIRHPMFLDGTVRDMLGVMRDADPSASPRGMAADLSPNIRNALSLLEHTRTIKPHTRVKLVRTDRKALSGVQERVQTFYRTMLDDSAPWAEKWKTRLYKSHIRAYATPQRRHVVVSQFADWTTYIHEYGHALEFSDPRALKRAAAFLEARTKGEELVPLRLLSGRGYRRNERARPDKFYSPYMGKDYRDRQGRVYATEVSSMGFESLALPGAYHKLDDESLWFMLGQLAGR